MTVVATWNRAEPTSAVNTKTVSDGTMASTAAHNRNAAQSARKIAKNRPVAAASRKPGSGVVGATTCWNDDHDACSACRAAVAVSAVGSRNQVVWAKKIQVASTRNPGMARAAVRGSPRPLRRAPSSPRWVTTVTTMSGVAKSPPANTRLKLATTDRVTSTRKISAAGSWRGRPFGGGWCEAAMAADRVAVTSAASDAAGGPSGPSRRPRPRPWPGPRRWWARSTRGWAVGSGRRSGSTCRRTRRGA